MARPEKTAEEKLSKLVSFRLTDVDYSVYQRKIEASGLSQSEFFRKYVLSLESQ